MANRERQGRDAGCTGLGRGQGEGHLDSYPLLRGNREAPATSAFLREPVPYPLPSSTAPSPPPVFLLSRGVEWGWVGDKGTSPVSATAISVRVPCEKQMSVGLSCGEYSLDLSHKNRKTATRTNTAGARICLSDGGAQSQNSLGLRRPSLRRYLCCLRVGTGWRKSEREC